MGIQDGTYGARPGQARVYENDNGSLVLCMEVQIEGGPVLKSYHTLAKADGTLMTRTIDNLKAWSGWDGTDPFWFADNDLTGFAVEVVIENQPGRMDPTRMYPTVKWVNPPGGGAGGGMAESGDRRAILAKYGGKLRANAGGVPAAVRPAPRVEVGGSRVEGALPVARTVVPSPAPAPRPIPRPPAVATAAAAKTSDMNACWGLMCELCGKMPKAQLEQEWFAAVGIIEGKDQADMTPEEWGRVEAHILGKYGVGDAHVPGGAVGRSDGAAATVEADDVTF
jgi:hypothetical protein